MMDLARWTVFKQIVLIVLITALTVNGHEFPPLLV